MRPISLGTPGRVNADLWKKWVDECFAEIERASYDDVASVADDFTVTNYVPTRTLNASTATLSDVANVLCTLIADIQNRGMKRSQ